MGSDHPGPDVVLQQFAGRVASVDYRWTLPSGEQYALTNFLSPTPMPEKDAA